MPVVNTTPPTVEPVSVAEAKRWVKEDLTDANNDTDIGVAIKACREVCENDTRRALITQAWKLTLDYFPSPNCFVGSSYLSTQWGDVAGPLLTWPQVSDAPPYAILLPLPPLQSVQSVKYVDANGTQQTLDPSLYLVDTYSLIGQVVPSYGNVWPLARRQPNSVEVNFTCGYGDAADAVPACARLWMKAYLGANYEIRQSEFVMVRGSLVEPATVERLLDPIRIRSY